MLTGKTYAFVSQPEEILAAGVYIWADKRDEILWKAEQKGLAVEILLEKKIGNKQARLARIEPTPRNDHRPCRY
jgi:hypothetical protein